MYNIFSKQNFFFLLIPHCLNFRRSNFFKIKHFPIIFTDLFPRKPRTIPMAELNELSKFQDGGELSPKIYVFHDLRYQTHVLNRDKYNNLVKNRYRYF